MDTIQPLENINIAEVCRACLETCEQYKLLFEDAETIEKRSMGDVFFDVVKIEIKSNTDSSPTRICLACSKDLINAYKFIQKSQQNNERLLEYLKTFSMKQPDCLSEFPIDIPDHTIVPDFFQIKVENETISEYAVPLSKDKISSASTSDSAESDYEDSPLHEEEKINKMQCTYCSRIFKRLDFLENHKRKHEEEMKKKDDLGEGTSTANNTARKSRKSGIKCCITDCKRSKRNNPGARLFRFPPLPEGNIWWEVCNIKEPRENISICDRHFDPNLLGKRRLKSGAFPTRFLGKFSDEDRLDEKLSTLKLPTKSEHSPSNDCFEAKCSNCEHYAELTDCDRKKDIFLQNPNFDLKTTENNCTIEIKEERETVMSSERESSDSSANQINSVDKCDDGFFRLQRCPVAVTPHPPQQANTKDNPDILMLKLEINNLRETCLKEFSELKALILKQNEIKESNDKKNVIAKAEEAHNFPVWQFDKLFPINSDEQLNTLNNVNETQKIVAITTVRQLIYQGGLCPNMNRVFGNRIIVNYNYEGKRGKKSLKDLANVNDILFKAAFRNGYTMIDYENDLRNGFKKMKNRHFKNECIKRKKVDVNSEPKNMFIEIND